MSLKKVFSIIPVLVIITFGVAAFVVVNMEPNGIITSTIPENGFSTNIFSIKSSISKLIAVESIGTNTISSTRRESLGILYTTVTEEVNSYERKAPANRFNTISPKLCNITIVETKWNGRRLHENKLNRCEIDNLELAKWHSDEKWQNFVLSQLKENIPAVEGDIIRTSFDRIGETGNCDILTFTRSNNMFTLTERLCYRRIQAILCQSKECEEHYRNTDSIAESKTKEQD